MARDLGSATVLVGLMTIALAGCTLQDEILPDGSSRHQISFLTPIRVANPGPDGARSARVSGIGILFGPDQTTLGLFRSLMVRFDTDCRLMLFDPNSEQFDQLRTTLGNGALCDESSSKGKSNDTKS